MAPTGNQSETANTNTILNSQRNPSTRPDFVLIRPTNGFRTFHTLSWDLGSGVKCRLEGGFSGQGM